MMSTSLLFSLFLACGDKSSSDTADETTSDQNTEDTEDTNTEEVDPNAPIIETGDAYCYTVGGSTEGDQWAFTFSFTDPQGIETVPRLQTGAISVKNSAGQTVSVQDPACSWDNASCLAYVFTTQVGVSCDQAEATTIEYQITDEDGNLSNKFSLTGYYLLTEE